MPSKSKKTRARGPGRASPSTPFRAPAAGVPIVALGASAGGLSALEIFFRNVPPESGTAFVLAMHLSPERDSQLAQILQGATAMPVTQVNAGVDVVPDHVYVIAPRHHFAVQGNRLHVSSRGRPPSAVIDHLFQSLAEDREERAVGILFSGSSADGTLGMQAIKERGGLLLAQDPAEAEFAAMPRSIIATGLVDFVLPVAEMPARLMALRDGAPRPALLADRKVWLEDDAHALEGGPEQSNDALILANQEMQSLNEELTAVNQELQTKIEEHRRVNSDLHLLVESTHMATIFLDQQLNVLLYTPESTKLFNLLPIDIGRPLEHLSHHLTYAGVLRDARQVLECAKEMIEESVNGLAVGAPVKFQGVPVGSVTDLLIQIELTNKTFEVPVQYEIDLNRLTSRAGTFVDLADPNVLRQQVTDGLRAQLQMESIVTGQLYVELTYRPDASPADLAHGPTEHLVILTTPSLLAAFGTQAGSLVGDAMRILFRVNEMLEEIDMQSLNASVVASA